MSSLAGIPCGIAVVQVTHRCSWRMCVPSSLLIIPAPPACSDPAAYKLAEDICVTMGQYFQVGRRLGIHP